MLRCLIDISISENSKCAKCCIYCNEKETCEYRCVGSDRWKTEDDIAENCKNNYFGGALKRNKKCKKCVVDSKNIYGKPSNYEERDKM